MLRIARCPQDVLILRPLPPFLARPHQEQSQQGRVLRRRTSNRRRTFNLQARGRQVYGPVGYAYHAARNRVVLTTSKGSSPVVFFLKTPLTFRWRAFLPTDARSASPSLP